MVIQIIATIIILSIFSQLIKKILKDKASLTKIIFWVLFWGISLIIIWLPKETIDSMGNIFGVGRGIDVLVYLSVILLFYFNFKQTERIDKLEKDITKTCKECGHISRGTHKTCDNLVTKEVTTRGKSSSKEVRCNGAWDVVKEFSAKTQFVFDEISETKQMEVLENSTTVQTCIKMGLYPKNYAMCKNMYGRSCPYLSYCHQGKEDGLIKVEKNK